MLVTGASGFAGSHIMDALLEAGHRVRALVRTTSNLRFIPQDRVEMRTADVRDVDSLGALVEGVDWVFHFGGLTRARTSEEFFQVNTAGTGKLASAFAAQAPEGALFLFCSSLAACGPSPSAGAPRTEADPPQPITPYGESKLAAERWLERNLPARVRLVTVRPAAVYGPRDEAILELFRWARHGWLPLPSARDARVSVVHARDLARACLVLADRQEHGPFHVSDGAAHSWEHVGEIVGRALGRRLRPLRIPRWVSSLAGELGELAGSLSGHMPVVNRDKVRDIHQPYWTCDSSKVQRAGFTPAISLDEGLTETADWYREAGWL